MRPSPFGEACPARSYASDDGGVVRAAGNALVLVAVPASLFWFPVAAVPGLGNVSGGDVALIALWGITALELLVAFLQAYVFAILTCIYLNDAIHPGH